MRETKVDLLANLLRYINNLEKGNKTVVFMTALLISWEGMEVAQVEKIITDTRLSCAMYDAQSLADQKMH